MQAFARIPSSPGPSGTSLIPGYSFNSSGYGYDGFIQPRSQQDDGSEGGEPSSVSQQQQGGEGSSEHAAQGQQMKVGVRSQVVEDMYAVPENYLEIEGELGEPLSCGAIQAASQLGSNGR